MSRKFVAFVVSSALALSSVSTSAWSAPDVSVGRAAQATAAPSNPSPLPPGGAAGIKQAQGSWENSPWVGLGLVALFVGVAWILLDDDEDEDSVSTGT
jgi:hypothetical protein